MDGLTEKFRALEVKTNHVVKIPTVKKWIYAVDFDEAKTRLIGKAYNDFKANFGNITKMEKGSDFVDVYGDKENGKTLLARYYIKKGNYSPFRQQFSFKFCTFAIFLCLIVPVNAGFEDYLSDLNSSASDFAGAISSLVLLMTLGSFALRSLAPLFILLNSILICICSLTSGVDKGRTIFAYFIITSILNSIFLLIRFTVKTKNSLQEANQQKVVTFGSLLGRDPSDNETENIDLEFAQMRAQDELGEGNLLNLND